MTERVVLCLGTKKGAFVAEATKVRGKFSLRGPFGPGVAVYSTLVCFFLHSSHGQIWRK